MADDLYRFSDPFAESATPPTAGEQNTVQWSDYLNALKVGTAGVQAGVAGARQYIGEKLSRTPETMKEGPNELERRAYKLQQEIYADDYSPGAKRIKAQSLLPKEGQESAWGNLRQFIALNGVESAPSIMASVIPAALVAPVAGVAAGTYAAGVAGGLMNAGDLFNDISGSIEKKSDEELRADVPAYAAYRNMMDEKSARAALRSDMVGFKPVISAAFTILTTKYGLENVLARRGAGEAIMGRGKSALIAGAGEAGQEFGENLLNKVMSGSVQKEYGLSKASFGEIWQDALREAVDGAVVAGVMGAGPGALAGRSAKAAPNGVNELPPGAPDPAQQAALSATLPTAPAPEAQPTGLGRQKVEEIRARARAAQQPPKGTGTGAPVQPSEVPTGNPSQPTRSPTEYPEGEQMDLFGQRGTRQPELFDFLDRMQGREAPAAADTTQMELPFDQRGGVPPRLAEVYARLTSRGNATGQQVAPMAAAVRMPSVPIDIAAALQRQNPAVNDTGMNVQEPPAQLAAQQEELVSGQVPAQMFPAGTEPLPPPPGTQRVETPRGAFNINPSQVTPQQVQAASAVGRENEVLGLGDQNKADVMQRAAQTGAPLVAVQTQTPEGTPVREALATTGTAQQTAAQMEAQTGKPAVVKPVVEVVRQRRRATPPTPQPASALASKTTQYTPEQQRTLAAAEQSANEVQVKKDNDGFIEIAYPGGTITVEPPSSYAGGKARTAPGFRPTGGRMTSFFHRDAGSQGARAGAAFIDELGAKGAVPPELHQVFRDILDGKLSSTPEIAVAIRRARMNQLLKENGNAKPAPTSEKSAAAPQSPAAPRILKAQDDKLRQQLDKEAAAAERGNRGKQREYSDNERKAFLRRAATAVEEQGEKAPQFYKNALKAEEERATATAGKSGRAKAGSPAAVAAAKLRAAWQEEQDNPDQRAEVRGTSKGGDVARAQQKEQEKEARDEARRAKKEAEPEELTKEQIEEAIRLVEDDIYEQIANTSSENVKKRLREDARSMRLFLEATAQDDPARFRAIVGTLTKKVSSIGIFNVDENRGGDQLVTSSDIENQLAEQSELSEDKFARRPLQDPEQTAINRASKMTEKQLLWTMARIEGMTAEEFREFLVDATFEDYVRALAANSYTEKALGTPITHFEPDRLKAAVRAMMREPIDAKEVTTLGKVLEKYLPKKNAEFSQAMIGFLHRRLINLVGDMKVYVVDERNMRKASGALGRNAAAGVYRTEFNDIALLSSQLVSGSNQSYWLAVHEGLHGALTNLMARSPKFKRQVDSLRLYIKNVVDSNPELQNEFGESNTIYGLTNADEFLSETVSNFTFQKLLSAVEITNEQLDDMGIRPSLRASIGNAFRAFVEAIRNYLGTPPDSVSALEAALRVTEDGLYIREFKGAGARSSAMTPEQRAARRAQEDAAELTPERFLSKQKPLQERISQELRSRGVEPEIAKEISDIINEEAQNGASFEQLLPLIQELADEFTPRRTAEDSPIVEGKLPSNKEFEAATASMLKSLEIDADALSKSLERAPTSAPWALKLRTFDNLAQRFAPFTSGVNPVRILHNLRENRGKRQADYMKQSEPINVQFFETEKKYKETPEGRKAWVAFSQFLNDVTMANIRPDLPLAENKHLGKDALNGMWSKAQYDRLASIYNDLPSDLQSLYAEGSAHLEKMYDQQGRSQLKAIFNAAGIDDDALVERFFTDKQTDADVKAIGPKLAELIEGLPELKKLGGAYFPLTRRGNWVVRGTVDFEKPTNAVHQVDDVTFDFKDRDEAIAFVEKQTSRPEIRTIHVDPKTNERFFTDADGEPVPVTAKDIDGETRYRVRVNNEIVEFADSKSAAEARKAELETAGVKTRDVTERKFDTLEDISAGLPPRLRALEAALTSRSGYKQLHPQQKNELLAALHEIAVRVPNAKPRRNIAGASLDVSRNVYDYTTRMAGLLAKIETHADVVAAYKQLEALMAKIESGTTGRSAAARAIANEVERRLNEDAKPESNAFVQGAIDRLLAISAADKLGSPAYSIVNMTQPGMLTYPVLAAKYGPVRALMAMKQAYRDVAALRNIGKGIKETGKAAANKRSSTNYIDDVMARLTDEGEKKMLADLAAVRSIEAESGIEVSRLLASREGVLGKGDAAIGWLEAVTRALPTAIEANNRTVSALAAYRLEMAKSKDQAKATEYAQEVVNSTQFLYTATNAPPVMNKAGVRLVTQFMKYPQAVYQLLGDQIGKAIRNDNPGDSWMAGKTIIYIAMTHGAMAGVLGLPWEPLKIALAITSGLAGVGPSPDDVEKEMRRLAAQALGKTGGEMLTRGVTRGLPGGLGFDLSSRMGLDNLISFGSPRSNTEKDIKAFLFDRLAGAPGSYVADLVKASNAAFNGEVMKTAELVIPLKVIADSLKAYRLMDEGKKSPGGRETLTPYTPTEAAIRAFGFTPQREAETSEQRRTVGGNIAQYNQQRTKLLQDYAQKPENRAKAMIAIEKFNRGKPEDLQITAKDRRDAEKRYQRTKEQSAGGFADTKRNRAILGDSGFYNIGR